MEVLRKIKASVQQYQYREQEIKEIQEAFDVGRSEFDFEALGKEFQMLSEPGVFGNSLRKHHG